MWAAGVSLISNIPRKEHWPLKTQLFLNAGRLDRLDLSTCYSLQSYPVILEPYLTGPLQTNRYQTPFATSSPSHLSQQGSG